MAFFPMLFTFIAYLLGGDISTAFFWGLGTFVVWAGVVLTCQSISGLHYAITHRKRHPDPAEVP